MRVVVDDERAAHAAAALPAPPDPVEGAQVLGRFTELEAGQVRCGKRPGGVLTL
jgi:hypothetical protein